LNKGINDEYKIEFIGNKIEIPMPKAERQIIRNTAGGYLMGNGGIKLGVVPALSGYVKVPFYDPGIRILQE